MNSSDFILVPKADINEGFSTGTVTKAALFMTRNFIFVIPFSSVTVFSDSSGNARFSGSKQFIEDFLPKVEALSIADVEKELISFLPTDRIYIVKNFEKFIVKTGWWIFGGMYIRRPGEQQKAINVQPKSKRVAICKFYNIV